MPLATGTQVGPYTIVGWLGAGGMGEVYRASDPRLARDVAIKVIPDDVRNDPSGCIDSNRKRAPPAAQSSEHSCRLRRRHARRAPYIVSELLEGESLRSRLQRAPCARKAVDWARQIAEGSPRRTTKASSIAT